MAHYFVDDPEVAIRELNRRRAIKLAVAIGSIIAIVIGIVAGVAAVYSDAPAVEPGLQSR
jgi:hypothetical protein